MPDAQGCVTDAGLSAAAWNPAQPTLPFREAQPTYQEGKVEAWVPNPVAKLPAHSTSQGRSGQIRGGTLKVLSGVFPSCCAAAAHGRRGAVCHPGLVTPTSVPRVALMCPGIMPVLANSSPAPGPPSKPSSSLLGHPSSSPLSAPGCGALGQKARPLPARHLLTPPGAACHSVCYGSQSCESLRESSPLPGSPRADPSQLRQLRPPRAIHASAKPIAC